MNLEESRAQIEEVDSGILELMARRVDLARDVLAAKQERGLPIDDPEQNGRVLDRATGLAMERGLDVGPVREIFKILIRMNIEKQLELMGRRGF